MDRRLFSEVAGSSLRAFPRIFVGGEFSMGAQVELPDDELHKLRNVLRLRAGDYVVLCPGDGRAVLAELDGRTVHVREVLEPETEPRIQVTLALGLPKPDALETAIRMGSEMGIARFLLFDADRTVVRWDADKREKRLVRLRAIAREAAEVAFRVRLPEVAFLKNLEAVLSAHPDCVVLSESDRVLTHFVTSPAPDELVLVVGPEGGFAPREMDLIGDRGRTLGPRVMRVDTAVAATCALALLADPTVAGTQSPNR